MKKHFFLSAIFGLAMAAAPSSAAVTVTFMSRDSSANSYPHAFVRVTGTTDANPGVPIDTNYGFTAIVAGPGVLLGNLCVGGILGGERRQSRVFTVMPSLWGMN